MPFDKDSPEDNPNKDSSESKKSLTQVDFSQRKKYDYFNTLIQEDDVFIVLNSNHSGVLVPDHLKNNFNLSLRLSLAFNFPPVSDHEKVTSNLKFNGEYFNCEIPWAAIYAISDTKGREKSWPEDVPKELAKIIAKSLINKTKERIKEKLSLVIKNKKPDDSKAKSSKTRTSKTKSSKAELSKLKETELKETEVKTTTTKKKETKLELVKKEGKSAQTKRNPNLTRIK